MLVLLEQTLDASVSIAESIAGPIVALIMALRQP